jgi:DNA-binding CsgD family transcriptional regulator
MTRFDEGMAASAAGEAADLRTLGDLYCAANLAAEITLDVSRFGQWTGVVMRFMERTGHPDLLSFCGTCCAEVCRAAGQWEDGEGWLTRTLSQLQQSGQKARCLHPATRLASFRVAAIADRSGHTRAEAEAELALGSVRAAAFLRSLGVAGRTGPKLLGQLSKREIEVLRLLGEGLTNAEIAARLYISTKTVATHVGNVFAKLQLRNRAEAAAFAHRHLPAGAPRP